MIENAFPLISIIIPTYNRMDYLVQAIQSGINQTYNNIEIIIIDDGSTDGTEKRLKELLKGAWKEKNIFYKKQRNQGAAAARNWGVAASTGTYIQFLDSDDLLFPNKIEKQYDLILRNEADGCVSLGEIGETINSGNLTLGESFTSIKDLLQKLCSGRVHILSTPAALWEKELILKSGLWNEELTLGDDFEFHLRALVKAKKIIFHNEKLFFVRSHSGEKLSNFKKDIKKIESAIKTQQLSVETLKEKHLWNDIFQNGFLKRSRTVYANYLLVAKNKDLKVFENWLLNLSKSPVKRYDIIFPIYIRKIFGAKLILDTYLLKRNLQKLIASK